MQTQPTADRYSEVLEGADPLESLRDAPSRVRKLLRNLDEAALTRRPGRGKWSIQEVLAHLSDHEVIFGTRVRMIASHEQPALQAYNQDLFMAHLPHKKASASELFADWSAARAANARLLARLPRKAFARTGIHAERGEETLARVLTMCAGHDRIHEAQLKRLRPV